MAAWQRRGATLLSFLICGAMMVLGTLLYPLVLLFFSAIAAGSALFRRGSPAASAGPLPGGSGSPP